MKSIAFLVNYKRMNNHLKRNEFGISKLFNALIEKQIYKYVNFYFFNLEDFHIKNNKMFISKLYKYENNEFKIYNTEVNQFSFDIIINTLMTERWHSYKTLLYLLQANGFKFINNVFNVDFVGSKMFTTSLNQELADIVVPNQYISNNKKNIMNYIESIGFTGVIKPSEGFGGKQVYKIDSVGNINNIVSVLLEKNKLIIVQPLIENIGDKRIVMFKNKILCYFIRTNEGLLMKDIQNTEKFYKFKLTNRDKYICSKVMKVMNKYDINLYGIDILGDYLTEINVQSIGGYNKNDIYYTNFIRNILNFIDVRF